MKKNAKRGVGRPMAEISIPNRKFTFADLMEANTHVTPLTLRKFLARDVDEGRKSLVVRIKEENREPNSKHGLGRKTFVYVKRSKLDGAKKSAVSVNVGTAASKAKSAKPSYADTKAALLGTPATVVKITPAPAPVAPAPVAPELAPA